MNSNIQLPKVSVIIAVYNNAQYLPLAINSALSQDYPNLDVWVIDDCSTEELCLGNEQPNANWISFALVERQDIVDKCRYYSNQEKPLYYIRLKKNSGPSVARNVAIANAMRNGSHLFQILDSDDVMYPNKVTELIKPILEQPDRIAITYADYIIQRDNCTHYESKPCFDYMRFFGGDCHIHSGSLVSGVALKDRYPYFYPEDQRVCEDYFLWRTLLRSGQWMAHHIAEPLTLVRSHGNDSTNSVKKEIWERDYRKTMMSS